ncbi:type VII secretion-associated serine protease mycosin [Nocardia huaxiensis]|uniref:Type VII secretion-associated serine protease mycosin n=1 Tax=Nocardia huaxiensis TaxID=2755382 RepID=A0A7D6ZLK2_9NOCA|nr:type VII secretion-associated serine protease mycosin [Nocardia huaxiensis]QLY34159.1 type VII secretion-associated serine protease mycosin [Nocardia huaxiensis]
MILAASLTFGAPPAAALTPPGIIPDAFGIAAALADLPTPLEKTEQKGLCLERKLVNGPPSEPPVAQRVLDLPSAWQFSRGAGQKVAVIDTGVNPHPRLRAVEAGGDYVSDTDGLVDCDSRGTLIAGIIAAQPSPDDAFAGVAPEADILSIRQYSLAWSPADRERANDRVHGDMTGAAGYGNVNTLAGAVVRAVEMGATVINISEVGCTAASSVGPLPVDAALGAAVKYAFDRNVVVVSAAGDLTANGTCRNQNADSGWERATTVVMPAWYAPYVLSVASVDPDGNPSALSMNGPWVSVAAVGRRIVSLDSKPGGTGLVDAEPSDQGLQPIESTSFAAPYVAGLAALVRARFPELTAAQVMDRIIRTAHAPGPGRDDRIGAGLVDPVAALTAQLPDQPIGAGAGTPRVMLLPADPIGPDPLPRRVAVIGSLTCLLALAVGAALAIPWRRSRDDELPDLD